MTVSPVEDGMIHNVDELLHQLAVQVETISHTLAGIDAGWGRVLSPAVQEQLLAVGMIGSSLEDDPDGAYDAAARQLAHIAEGLDHCAADLARLVEWWADRCEDCGELLTEVHGEDDMDHPWDGTDAPAVVQTAAERIVREALGAPGDDDDAPTC